ncbi:MAG: alanine dehydrogenase [Anaerolineae bacterium]
MNFGVPREVRPLEYRVGFTPASVHALVSDGHQVFVERGAGLSAGFRDRDYQSVGGNIVYSPAEAYGRADVVVKVTRPTEAEYERFRTGQVLMAFLHMAVASPDLLLAFRERQLTAVGYETIQADDGALPVLLPTSEVAGRMAPVIAGQLLESVDGGRGILLSGIPGVPPAAVVILGAGVLGTNAARSFLGLGAEVTVLDKDLRALQALDRVMEGHVGTMLANPYNVAKAVAFADVLVGAVAVAGERAPVLVSRSMVQSMQPRAVIIDFAIDNGGCIETSRPTNHINPSYIEEGVVHYCVPNVPARVARTASYALANATLPYLLDIGREGMKLALESHPDLRRGVNVYKGRLAHSGLAEALGREVEVDL